MQASSSTAAFHVCAFAYRFTGKERDQESGNDYFGARYYASTMGRWLSPDWSAKVEPVPYSKLDDPQTLNLYAYVTNNPLTRADADGHATWYDPSGHRLGTDGLNDNGVVVAKANQVSYSSDHSLIDVAGSSLPMYSFTQAEGNAIQASVDRTLAPAGGDHQGGFHEEGFTEDANGIHTAAPGPAYQQGESTAHINQTTSDSTTMIEHTHPAGTQNAAGSTSFGETQFDPKPSTGPGQDVPNAALRPTNLRMQSITYVEASAGTKRVYVYTGSGVQADLPLSAFPRQ
jgi:RHS repeat-associated protein